MILDEKMLKLYASEGFNTLLSGRPGVGKTEIIKGVFSEVFGDKWAYFSASTMDAWVDFIGVPKSVTREDGKEVLELIRPARFADDNVEAIFFDEYNRAPAKVRNAVMELIQFKSINGRKFNNLKVIWAAINPYDEEGTYDVDKLDPAQLDRFQIQIDIPYKIDRSYFKRTHGTLGTSFVEWWNDQSQEVKYLVSPRRVDDAVRVYKARGKLDHVLPKQSNIKDLQQRINNISLDDEWNEVSSYTSDEKMKYFGNVSNVARFEKYILDNFSSYAKYIPEDYFIGQLEVKQLSWINATLKGVKSSIPKSVISTIEDKYGESFEDTLNRFKGIVPQSNFGLDLSNKRVVVTGKFKKSYSNANGNSRADIEGLIKNAGGIIQKSVSKTTNYVINADQNSITSKITTAQSLGIPILSEEEFHSVYG